MNVLTYDEARGVCEAPPAPSQPKDQDATEVVAPSCGPLINCWLVQGETPPPPNDRCHWLQHRPHVSELEAADESRPSSPEVDAHSLSDLQRGADFESASPVDVASPTMLCVLELYWRDTNAAYV